MTFHDRTLLASLSAISTDFPQPGSSALYPPKCTDATHPSPIMTEPPTPASTVTIRNIFNASSSRHDELFLPSTMSPNTMTRSTSRTYRWIEEQQHHLTTSIDKLDLHDASAELPPLPALSLSQASTTSLVKGPPEAVARVESYVFVEGTVSQPTERAPRGRDAHVTQRPETPRTPPPASSRKSRNSQSIFHAPSPLRNLHLTFASRRPSAPVSSGRRAHSPASSTSTFRRHTEKAASHSRGSSLSTVNAIQRNTHTECSEQTATPPSKTATWKFGGRLSAAGPTSPSPSSPPPAPPPEDEIDPSSGSPPPRPSTSSSVTHSGSSTVYTRTSSDAHRKMHFGSIRSHSSTTIFGSSPSLWSLPTDASHINDPPESTKVIARNHVLSSSESAAMTWKPATPTNFGSVTTLLTSPKARKKRKLIISGIPPDDERRFEAVRKWCESFGELSSINRAPNGDLHIDFRKVEVADTVCRLNARVYISGVGSVCLSWFTGKRP
ncbi:hypothetical protein C8Q80DRAFT_1264869 [Daedaleopsis nitida]|nr:hypothetical protein C8Q80DRAFT_1264869 [Daedaleopsis nitida]